MVFAEHEQQSVERSSMGSTRPRSLDSSDVSEYTAHGGGVRRRRQTYSDEKARNRNGSNNNKRGSSTKNMVPLTSVEVNPFSPNHPLSALRSCSEFRKDTRTDDSQQVLKQLQKHIIISFPVLSSVIILLTG